MSFFFKQLSQEKVSLVAWRHKIKAAGQPQAKRLAWVALQPDWAMLKIAKTVEQQAWVSSAQSIWMTHKDFLSWTTLELILKKYLYNPWQDNQAQRGLQEVANYEIDLLPKPWLFRGTFNRKLKKQEQESIALRASVEAEQLTIGLSLEERKKLLEEYGHDDPIEVMIQLLQKAGVVKERLTGDLATMLTPHFDVKEQLFSKNHVHSVKASQLNVVKIGMVQRQEHLEKQPVVMAVTDKNEAAIEEQHSAKHWWWKIWIFLKARARDLSLLTLIVASIVVAATGPSGILVLVLLIASAVFFYTGIVPFAWGIWRRLKDDPKRLEAEMQTGYQDWYQQVCSFQEDWLKKISTIEGFRASFYLSTYQHLQEELVVQLKCFEAFKPSRWAFWRTEERKWISVRISELKKHQATLSKQWENFPVDLILLLKEKLQISTPLVAEKEGYSLGIDQQSLLEIQKFLEAVKVTKEVWNTYNEVVHLGHALIALFSQFEQDLTPQEDTSLIHLPWETSHINMSPKRWLVFAKLLSKTDQELVAVQGLLSLLMPESRSVENIQHLEKHLTVLFSDSEQKGIKEQIGCILWKTFQGEFFAKDYCSQERRSAIKASYADHVMEIEKLEASVLALKENNHLTPYMNLLDEWQKLHYPKNSLRQSLARSTALWQLRGVHGAVEQKWEQHYYEAQKSNLKEVLYTALMKGQHSETLDQIIRLLVDKEFWDPQEYVALRRYLIDQRIDYMFKNPKGFTRFEEDMILETSAEEIVRGNLHWFSDKTKKWLKTNPSNKSVYQWLLCLKNLPVDRDDIDHVCQNYMRSKMNQLTVPKDDLDVIKNLIIEVDNLEENYLPKPGIFQTDVGFKKKIESFLKEEKQTAYELLQRVFKYVPRNTY